MTNCPHCGGDLDVGPSVKPPVKPTPDYRSLARHFGAVRGRAGIYRDEDAAAEAFAALYKSQPVLASAAMAGWREAS